MERMIERACGLDVHKTTITACVRVVGPRGERLQEVQTFGTTSPELLALRDWLEAQAVTHVAMESTGGYRKAAYYVLEDRLTCLLVNPAHNSIFSPSNYGQPAVLLRGTPELMVEVDLYFVSLDGIYEVGHRLKMPLPQCLNLIQQLRRGIVQMRQVRVTPGKGSPVILRERNAGLCSRWLPVVAER
jgi:Transposase